MGERLLWAPDYLAARGRNVHLFPGWATRTRSSSPDGLDAILGISPHHTATRVFDPQRECELLWIEHQFAPVGQLYLDRIGDWWVGCAGASNTQGEGGPMLVSQGVISLNNGNRNTISIEAGNDGRGEPWPNVMIDSYIEGTAGLIEGVNGETRWHLEAGDVFSHSEWAAGRKLDPFGPARICPQGGTWSLTDGMDRFRGAVFLTLLPPILQPPEEDDMDWITRRRNTRPAVYRVGDGKHAHDKNANQAVNYIEACVRDKKRLIDFESGRAVTKLADVSIGPENPLALGSVER